jgi:spermidine synthase
MFVVWVAVRQIAPEDFKVLIRTLMEVFPHTTMWLDGYYSALVCTPRPLIPDADEIEARCAAPTFREVLDEAGLDSPLDLLAGFVAGPAALGRFAAGQPLNTEDRPMIEFRTPRQGNRLNSEALAATILELLVPIQEPLCPAHVTADYDTQDRLRQVQQAREMARFALAQKCRGRHLEAAQLFQRALEEHPHDDLARYELEIYLVAHGTQCLNRELFDQARHVFEQAVQVNPRSVGALASLAALEEAAGKTSQAEELRRRALSLDPHNSRLRERFAHLPDNGSIRRY